MTQQANSTFPRFPALNIGLGLGIITEADVRLSAQRWTCLPEIDDLQAVLLGTVDMGDRPERVFRLVYKDLAGKFTAQGGEASDQWASDYLDGPYTPPPAPAAKPTPTPLHCGCGNSACTRGWILHNGSEYPCPGAN
jgi:hypothetical protein